ncbi:MAG TPA: diacylglycerol kinase family protein [Polyangia bacterium]|nr:diacylglycerol kinase family protein [Polyangia bacterium]
MDPQRPLVIVNPRAGGGLTEARWAKLVGPLTEGLGPFDSAFTTAGGHAVLLAHEATAAGRKLIVALGGDGTISEVANGILAAAEGSGGTTELGIIPRGTGGDFRRMLGLSTALAEAAAHVREKPAHAIDVGRVTFTAHDGSPALRYFVNVASFGFSSAVASKANASSKRLGGKLAFLGATVRSLATYDNTDVWLSVDGGPRQRRRVLMAAVGNGRFFGGGMKICPSATLDSGRLDLVVVGDLGRMEVLMKVSRIYSGSHLTMPDVRNEPVRRLEAVPAEEGAVVPLELDGETPGRLPAVFEVMPGALRVRF